MDADGNAVQMILGQCPISQCELLVRNLSLGSRITTTFAGVDNDIVKNLIIRIAARKND